MQIDQQAVLWGIGASVAVIVWLVRLEGRINMSDQRYVDISRQHDEIKEHLRVISEKLDAMRYRGSVNV